MIIYSKKISLFIKEVQQIVKRILEREVGLKVGRNYFLDCWHSFHPINIVIYNDTSRIGYFDPAFYELGFHECLMHVPQEQLQNVIRHEVAHYITFINHRTIVTPHSKEFRDFCKKMGWGDEVQSATIKLEEKKSDTQEEDSSVLRKVKKLLALATSSNVHEAETAMIMSQQLLLKHHMEEPAIDEEDGEKMVLKRIMKQKRTDAKTSAISNILQTFFVSVVYNRVDDFTYLEILGNAVNVSVAEYVAGVLNHQLDLLWDQARKSSCIRGKVAKNSFFYGVARGYCDKVSAFKRTSAGDTAQALMIIEKKLDEARAIAYPRLRSGRSNGYYCEEASLLGQKAGKQLNINPAINKTSGGSDKLSLECYR